MPITTTGMATIEIGPTRLDGGAEPYGLAWAKIRDRTPRASPFQPLGREPWAVGSARPAPFRTGGQRGSRDGQVARDRQLGADVPLPEAAAAKRSMVTPGSRLSPGGYSVILGPGITDAAGNAPAPAWSSFTVADTKSPSRQLLHGRSASFPQVPIGYRFDASGR